MINAWPPHFFTADLKFLWLSVSCFQPLDFVVFSLSGRAIVCLIDSVLYLNSVTNLHLIELRQRILCILLFGTFWGLHLYLWLLFYPIWLCIVTVYLKLRLTVFDTCLRIQVRVCVCMHVHVIISYQFHIYLQNQAELKFPFVISVCHIFSLVFPSQHGKPLLYPLLSETLWKI